MSGKPVLYEFAGSCWANAPKVAISEMGYKKGDIELKSLVLLKGENFNPEFLKHNPAGTVPTLTWDGKDYTNTTDVIKQILKNAPHPPKSDAHSSTSIIEEIHAPAHDPNDTLLLARNEQEYQAKKSHDSVPHQFLTGRQEALDKYAPDAPEEFRTFLQKKQASNKQLLDFYDGNPDDATKQEIFSKAESLWTSTGIVLRGVVTQAIQKTGGPFIEGAHPGEADFHVIAWLARQLTNLGVEAGEASETAIPKLQKATGGHNFDPVIGKYWDAWIKRESFYGNELH